MKQKTFSDKNTAIHQMNTYGRDKIPFIFVISYSMEQGWVIPLDQLNPSEFSFSIPGRTNAEEFSGSVNPFSFRKSPEDFETYRRKFEFVKKQIAYGNTYLLNLTCLTPLQTSLTLDEIFHFSKAQYKLRVQDHFVVFSPEPFVRIKKGIISSYPMKGTIDASIPGAKESLLADTKELAEHYTITDLIRNDLSIVAKNVTVKLFRYIESIPTNYGALLQASTVIEGELQGNYSEMIGNIVFNLLPAGSVTGAPKQQTLNIIKDCEDYDRGFYTGIFGVFDGVDLESAVMIRFIESTRSGLVFKSGGGITSFSKAEKEYREMIDKVYVPIT